MNRWPSIGVVIPTRDRPLLLRRPVHAAPAPDYPARQGGASPLGLSACIRFPGPRGVFWGRSGAGLGRRRRAGQPERGLGPAAPGRETSPDRARGRAAGPRGVELPLLLRAGVR